MKNKEPENNQFANLNHLHGKCQIMWYERYYDGPISGVLMYEGDIHFFTMIEEYEPTTEDIQRWREDDDDDSEDDFYKWYRKHAVYALSDDDKIRLVTLHALWQSHMGVHSDYWPIKGGTMHPRRKGDGRKVPALHYGPSGNRETAGLEYKELAAHWIMKYGKYSHKDKEPIGFIYHGQLYGGTVTANGVSVENEELE